MASYWKSQPRKFCEVCKCWIGDNRASIDFHERGKSHQEKKRKQLDQIKKQSVKQHKINQKAGLYLKQMEKAAKKKYIQDLKEQGITVNASEFLKQSESPKSSETESVKPKQSKPTSFKHQPTTNVKTAKVQEAFKPCSSSSQAQPFGKWTTVEKPQEQVTFKVENTAPRQIEFNEKSAVLSEEDGQQVSFKKRKVNSNKKNRSIRSRVEND